jgi:hypothetical protein
MNKSEQRKAISKKQQADIDFYLGFCPENLYHLPTREEINEFLDFSEKGIKPTQRTGGALGQSLNPISIGKSCLGLNITLWQEGVLEGTVPYYTLLGGFEGKKRKWWQFWKPLFAHELVSRRLVDYMKTQMFKGHDADLIERVYQQILHE